MVITGQEVINNLDKRVKQLTKEVKAYAEAKEELEKELIKKDRQISLYLGIIDKYENGKNKDSDIDIELRLSKLEDKVTEMGDDLSKYTKLLISTRNTINEFLSRIYK